MPDPAQPPLYRQYIDSRDRRQLLSAFPLLPFHKVSLHPESALPFGLLLDGDHLSLPHTPISLDQQFGECLPMLGWRLGV